MLRGVRVPLLAFADDVVLLSTSAAGLQRKLELLEGFSRRTELLVNLQKTEVVVFGGKVEAQKAKHEFRYGGERVEIVESYRYLGVQFHCNGSFRQGVQFLAEAGRKAAFAMDRRCKELGLRKISTKLGIFDTRVSPILQYGGEVWGPGYGREWGWNGDGDCLETVHRLFLRSLLRARKSTLSKAVLGEMGRFPLAIVRWERVFRFVNRTSALSSDRLARLALEESKAMWAAGQGGWYSKVMEKARELATDEQLEKRGLDVKMLRDFSEMAYMQDLREDHGTKYETYFEVVKEAYEDLRRIFHSIFDNRGTKSLRAFLNGEDKIAVGKYLIFVWREELGSTLKS
ncbi:protein with reverse transcriptase domain [Klebsormidium nitens]|uniref:Protein with reverse transcriptase domain n=1 Tax=Klebsormidium nitens TaxID=105231 RepID=A0A1Y1IG86_KLENI|nr:protein with reverse transcriptase domain [Klebsormidium nitens]|eukprot:GAQ89854.1 protein with reverse transcriptase domain [Klebsormidium nitens]